MIWGYAYFRKHPCIYTNGRAAYHPIWFLQVKVPVAPFLTACIIMSSAIPKQHKLRFLLGKVADCVRFLYPRPAHCAEEYTLEILVNWQSWILSLNSEGPDFLHPGPGTGIFDENDKLRLQMNEFVDHVQALNIRCCKGFGHVTMTCIWSNTRCWLMLFLNLAHFDLTDVCIWFARYKQEGEVCVF